MASALTLGYIRSSRADLVWFVALPLVATLIALGFQRSLPYAAHASIAVWITMPHHYATWVRSYGLREDWTRWRERLIAAPILLGSSVVIGSALAPMTLVIVLMLWDHQHSMMQQYGFSRIYDFKSGAGTPSTARLDFWLGVVLYGNMLIVAPLWSEFWVAELFHWGIGPRAEMVQWVQGLSWTVTGLFAAAYLAHLALTLARGHRVNPMKYAFLLGSYSLWYYVSWQDSMLVYLVAHRILHGVQYILMVYWYLDRKAERSGAVPRLLGRLSLGRYLWIGALYAVCFQLAIGAGLTDLSFGLVNVLQADGVLRMTHEQATGVYAATIVNAAGAIHYYVDSFIWKVSDSNTQVGL
jgi:hypothetical protein